MIYLINILEAIKAEVKSGIASEQEQGLDNMSRDQMGREAADLTEAAIGTLKQNTFTPLKVYLSWMCRRCIEQGIKLSEIMGFFDEYEKVLKDEMALYLQKDLPSLNRYRREFDTLLDKARVFLSDYFFVLYEDTVFKQFERLRVIHEITAQLTSTLDLTEVLNFIVTNTAHLFKADCGSILLIDQNNVFSDEIGHGWQMKNSASEIIRLAEAACEVNIIHLDNVGASGKTIFDREKLFTAIVIKLRIQKRVIGVLVIGFRAVRKVTATDEMVLTTFANQAAIAVNNAQLYGEKDNKLQERIREVTVLLEQNRALLHSMREGVIAVNASGIINLINNEAQRLFDIHENVIGKKLLDVVPNSRLPLVVQTRKAEYDQEQNIGTGVIITNRVPVIVHGEVIGAIATFRDRQDVKLLAEELVGVKSLLESMRAQSHEFFNKLHAISGLIEMEQYDKVVELITDIYKHRQECVSFIVKRIKEQATAGLLLGKISQANEQAISLRLNPRSKLISLPPNFSSVSMVTVLGNLISNAMEAVANVSVDRRKVNVRIFQGKKFLNIAVDDYGCGIPEDLINTIYRRGFSTKQGSRGLGLALVKQEVEVSGGKIAVRSVRHEGTQFMVKIPVRQESNWRG